MKKYFSQLALTVVFLINLLLCSCSRSGHHHSSDGASLPNNDSVNSVVIKANNSDTPGYAGIDNNTDTVHNYAGEYICVSLSRYIHAFSKLVDSHSAIPADMETMYGMSWVNGYVVDPVKKDVILVGQQRRGRPVYHAEDIFVNYHNVFDSTSAPYCSLDPDPENIRRLNHYLAHKTNDYETLINNARELIGGQKVVVGGVPLNSRSAKIMIYADYEMKRISQGLLQVGGIKSVLDLFATDASTNYNGPTMSRYWFHIKQGNSQNTYPNYDEDEGIVFINECPVVVLTEKQLPDRRGNLVDDVFEADETANSFAAEMSNKYNLLASENVLIAELENMFRLQACLRAIKFKEAISAAGADLSKINGFALGKGNELPASLPGLLNYKKLENKTGVGNEERTTIMFFTVAGGVDQAMDASRPNSFVHDPGSLLIQVRQSIMSAPWGPNQIHQNIVFKPKKPRMSLNNRGIEKKSLYSKLLSLIKNTLKSGDKQV